MYVLADVQQRVRRRKGCFGRIGRGHLVPELLLMVRLTWLIGFANDFELATVENVFVNLESELGRELQYLRSAVHRC